jgi:F-type H+-transporting ATPase subunit delta
MRPPGPRAPGSPSDFTCFSDELNVALVSISRRYARALLEVALESGQGDRILAELEALATEIDAARDLRILLESPIFARSQRREVLAAVAERARLTKTTHDFLMLLVDRDRTALLRQIVRIYRDLADEAAGRVRATVTSPLPLSEAETSELEGALATATGKTVALSTELDPALLGGLVARVGDRVYDGSLKTQLERLRDVALEH